MWLPKRNASLAVLLAMSTAVAALPSPALADDEDPDLKIEYVGLSDDRTLTFKVTNVGKEKAPATKATVETLSPGAANEKTFQVPALDKRGGKHEITYTLATPCDGHRVRGIVELKKDENPGNNDVEVDVCAPKPKPESKPQGQSKPENKPSGGSGSGVAGSLADARSSGGAAGSLRGPGGDSANTVDYAGGPDGTDLLLPSHMRPGTHTIDLRPSAARTIVQTRIGGGLPTNTDGTVGWYQSDGFGGDTVAVSQQAVNFDLGDFDEIPRKFVSKAVLAFDESPNAWHDTDGNDRLVDGCVAQLEIASVEWASRDLNARVPSKLYEDVTPSAKQQWDVTHHVRDQLREPIDVALRHGYTLDGSLMIDQLEAEGHSSCVSNVSNVRLTVTYTVLE